MNRFLQTLTIMLAVGAGSLVLASEASENALIALQHDWAKANYRLEGKERKQAFEQLIERADSYTDQFKDDAAIWIWSGIIKSTFAGVRGGLGALKYAKAAKADLERGMALNADALDGSAYTSLGTLYFNVPGWPIGFGDDHKARELLSKALEINPNGIDPNYFYAEYLRDQHKPQEAQKYYEKARQAPPRPGRQLADEGRRQEIARALEKIQKDLK